ncbi:MAG TPA: ankyrin repeat domain-containing protein [Nitrospirota bacterium]|nr:ankyrin repeat domain-containing protein [Nitrospirota bacterium]
MENKLPGPSKGYQKKPKKEGKDLPAPKPKKSYNPDYALAAAKKWSSFTEALESGNISAVEQLIKEGFNVNITRDGLTPLMVAASKGKTEIAEVILQAGVNINARGDDGRTALHKAAYDQTGTNIIDLLLHSGIELDAKDKSGKTALQLAEEKGHHDIARAIKKHQQQLHVDALEWKDFLNSPEGKPFKQKKLYDSLTSYAMFWWLPPVALGGLGLLLGLLSGAVILWVFIGAVAGLLVDLAIFLWQKKIGTYLDGIGPLPELDIHILREKKNAGEPLLYERNPETTGTEEAYDKEPSSSALEMEPDSSSPELAADSAPVDESSYREAPQLKKKWNLKTVTYIAVALVILILIGAIAIYRGSLANWYFAKKLEHKGVQFSEHAFLAEVSKNNEEAVDLFIKAGINIDAKDDKGRTALIIASEKGYVNLLDKLIKLDVASLNYFDKSGSTALMAASSNGRGNIVKSLVENGANVNYMVPSNEGAATALQAALDTPDFKDEHMKVITFLIQKGADVKGRNKTGRFPLLFAADHGRTDAAKVLIEHGADMNDADQEGSFSLLSASCKGHTGFVLLLADKGANMKMALADGQTPLMCAVRESHADTVKTLLERGATVNAKTVKGFTALTDAAGTGNIDIVKMLLAHGADPSYVYIPDTFTRLNGRVIAVKAKKSKITDVLGRIKKTASQDGYAINIDSKMEQRITLKAKAPWNKVLHELATKNHLVLVVKDKKVFVLQYNPSAIKHEAA